MLVTETTTVRMIFLGSKRIYMHLCGSKPNISDISSGLRGIGKRGSRLRPCVCEVPALVQVKIYVKGTCSRPIRFSS